MAAPPAAKLATIWAVTSWGHGDTPQSTMPWSAAKTPTVAGSGTGGGHSAAMPASCTPSVSMRPSAPGRLGQLVLERGGGVGGVDVALGDAGPGLLEAAAGGPLEPRLHDLADRRVALVSVLAGGAQRRHVAKQRAGGGGGLLVDRLVTDDQHASRVVDAEALDGRARSSAGSGLAAPASTEVTMTSSCSASPHGSSRRRTASLVHDRRCR